MKLAEVLLLRCFGVACASSMAVFLHFAKHGNIGVV